MKVVAPSIVLESSYLPPDSKWNLRAFEQLTTGRNFVLNESGYIKWASPNTFVNYDLCFFFAFVPEVILCVQVQNFEFREHLS